MFGHEASESGQVRRDRRNPHDGAFGGSVAPRLVVGRKDSQVATASELLVIDGEQRIRRVEELRVENDLHAILSVVEQLASSDGEKNLILGVVDDVVGADGRKRLSIDAEGAALQLDYVFLEDDVAARRNFPAKANLVKTVSDVFLHLVHSLAELLGNCLTPERFYVEIVGFGRHDDKGYDCDVGIDLLKTMVESGERLYEEIRAFVGELVSAGDEEVKRLVQFEVEMAVEVTSNEIVDFLLGDRVEILKLVNGGELLDSESIWRDDIRFPA